MNEEEMSEETKTMILLVMKDYESDIMQEIIGEVPTEVLEEIPDITPFVREAMIDVYLRADFAKIPLGDVEKIRNHLIVAAVSKIISDNDWEAESDYDHYHRPWEEYNDE